MYQIMINENKDMIHLNCHTLVFLNHVEYISESAFEGCSESLSINCIEGSYVHQYATTNNIKTTHWFIGSF